jgi:hypothetical protein
MLGLHGRSDDIETRHVRLRGAADGLTARRCMEAALADLAPSTIGLPPHALLVVRRLAPSTPLRLADATRGETFCRAVRADLIATLRQARRPWLDGAAQAADAVLFADESELMTCLLRDWRSGMLADRWWWTAVLRGMPVSQFARRSLLPRGDLLPAVLAQLAPSGAAVAWLASLHDDDAARAFAAVSEAHALASAPAETLPGGSASRASSSPSSAGGQSSTAAASRSAEAAPELPASTSAFAPLLVLVPELTAAGLTRAQRRVLAVTLSLQRAAAWTRTEGFAAALRALDTATEIAPASSADARLSWRDRAHSGARALPTHDSAAALPSARAIAAARPPQLPSREAAAVSRPALEHIDGSSMSVTPTGEGGAPVRNPAPQPDAAGRTSDLRLAVAEEARESLLRKRDQRRVQRTAPMASVEIETEFGGMFYLLNAALALGLYGDFTQPRAPNLALSPWDWLALVGRGWFGGEFERDPAWGLLAELAGRVPRRPPGADFAAPESWSVPAAWLAPWGGVAELAVHATRKRLQIWHAAGFAVLDVMRERCERPLRQARAACAMHDALRDARLMRMRNCPPRVGSAPGNPSLARWIGWILPYLDARLARALGVEDASTVAALVCRHSARLRCTATHLDVHLSLVRLPLALRFAGLDRDPGWIPAAGRTVAFHFE